MNQQNRGEIKTLIIFKMGQEKASSKNIETPQNHRPHSLLENICVESLDTVWENRQECHDSQTTSKANTNAPRPNQNSISLKDIYVKKQTDSLFRT